MGIGKFDSVKMMRKIRKKLSKELSHLSVKEKIELLKKELPEDRKEQKSTSKTQSN